MYYSFQLYTFGNYKSSLNSVELLTNLNKWFSFTNSDLSSSVTENLLTFIATILFLRTIKYLFFIINKKIKKKKSRKTWKGIIFDGKINCVQPVNWFFSREQTLWLFWSGEEWKRTGHTCSRIRLVCVGFFYACTHVQESGHVRWRERAAREHSCCCCRCCWCRNYTDAGSNQGRGNGVRHDEEKGARLASRRLLLPTPSLGQRSCRRWPPPVPQPSHPWTSFFCCR